MRFGKGLKLAKIAEAFGLQNKGAEFVARSSHGEHLLFLIEPFRCLRIYDRHPEAAPMTSPSNVDEFIELQDPRHPRETSAKVIGRSHTPAHRLSSENGTAALQTGRWIAEIKRLRLSASRSRGLILDVDAAIARRRGFVLMTEKAGGAEGSAEKASA